MLISRIEMTKPEIDFGQSLCRADTAIYLSAPGRTDTQVAHLKCMAKTSDGDSEKDLQARLLSDALRQLRWMPEVRSGEITLQDFPVITDVDTL